MVRYFTLEYWIDEGWYVGRLKEVPGVFSQGASFQKLEENIRIYMNPKNRRKAPVSSHAE